VYDKKGSIKAHAKLVQALLRIQLATLGDKGLINDSLSEEELILSVGKLETRVVFLSEE